MTLAHYVHVPKLSTNALSTVDSRQHQEMQTPEIYGFRLQVERFGDRQRNHIAAKVSNFRKRPIDAVKTLHL